MELLGHDCGDDSRDWAIEKEELQQQLSQQAAQMEEMKLQHVEQMKKMQEAVDRAMKEIGMYQVAMASKEHDLKALALEFDNFKEQQRIDQGAGIGGGENFFNLDTQKENHAPKSSTPKDEKDKRQVSGKTLADRVDGSKLGEKNRDRSKNKSKKQRKGYKSIDSLYESSDHIENSNSESSDDGSVMLSGDGNHRGGERKAYTLVSDIPQVQPFDLEGGHDLDAFLKEYERYCQRKYPGSTKHWVRELGNSLRGKVADLFKVVAANDFGLTYKEAQQRLREIVERQKRSVKYKRRDDFEKAKMKKNESLEEYAYRLETLARVKFGSNGIDRSKALLIRFIDTVPQSVQAHIRRMRKDKARWSSERLIWSEVMDELADGTLDSDGSGAQVDFAFGENESNADEAPQYKTYREALKACPPEVVMSFVKDVVREQTERESRQQQRDGGKGRNQSQNRSNSRNRSSHQGYQSGSQPSGGGYSGGNQIGNYRGNQSTGNQGGFWQSSSQGTRVQCRKCGMFGHDERDCRSRGCFGCGQFGHMVQDCRANGGECYSCGQHGHLKRFCPNRVVRCFRCNGEGHVSRFCTAPQPVQGGSGPQGLPAQVSMGQAPLLQQPQWGSSQGGGSQGQGPLPQRSQWAGSQGGASQGQWAPTYGGAPQGQWATTQGGDSQGQWATTQGGDPQGGGHQVQGSGQVAGSGNA